MGDKIIPRETAQELILVTFSQFYTLFEELELLTRNKSNSETIIIKDIYNILREAFRISTIEDSRNINNKVYLNIYNELIYISNQEINRFLNRCYRLARAYELDILIRLSENMIVKDKYDFDSIRVRGLLAVQNKVMLAEMYKEGGKGSHPLTGANGPKETYCNLATFDVADAVGFNPIALYGNRDRYNTSANQASDNLKKAEGSLIKHVSPERAQELANEGFVVIASWKNQIAGKRGHLATVRPSIQQFDPIRGPYLANVGLRSRSGLYYENVAFNGNKPVLYYYDSAQQNEYNFSNMLKIMEN